MICSIRWHTLSPSNSAKVEESLRMRRVKMTVNAKSCCLSGYIIIIVWYVAIKSKRNVMDEGDENWQAVSSLE